MRWFIAFAVLLLSYTPGYTQVSWTIYPENPTQAFLFDGPRQLGGYCLERRLYWPRIPKGWGNPCEPPVVVPLAFDYGVTEFPREPGYWHRGEKVDLAQLRKLIGDKAQKDDRNLLHFTVIGSESQCKDACAAVPEDLRLKLKVRQYRPEDWQVAGLGFTTGSPAVYLQDGSGKVLWREDGKVSVDAIRKKIEGYDPVKDPGPGLTTAVPPVTWLIGGGILLAFCMRKK